MLGALLVLLMPSLGAERIIHPAGAQRVTAPSWEIQKGAPTALGDKISSAIPFSASHVARSGICPSSAVTWWVPPRAPRAAAGQGSSAT